MGPAAPVYRAARAALVFKGGTSLSKAYGVIRRFSEDVDLTCDIRAIAPDLIGKAASPWPTSRCQEKKWSKTVDSAAADRALAQAVAAHKGIFFAESTPDGAPIDYHAAVTGALALAPSGDARQARAEDYRHMVEDGLLLDDAEPFEALLQRCQTLADKVNVAVRAGKS